MATMSVIFAIIPAAIYLAAGLPATAGTMSIGTLVAFASLQSGVFRPLMGLLNAGVQVASSLALFARVFEYLDLRRSRSPSPSTSVTLVEPRGHLRLEGVGFTCLAIDGTGGRWDRISTSPPGPRWPSSGRPVSGKSTVASR